MNGNAVLSCWRQCSISSLLPSANIEIIERCSYQHVFRPNIPLNSRCNAAPSESLQSVSIWRMHHSCYGVYIFVVYERGRAMEREREGGGGGSDPELSSCDSFSIQSTHHRTISDLIKQTEKRTREREKRETQRKNGEVE